MCVTSEVTDPVGQQRVLVGVPLHEVRVEVVEHPSVVLPEVGLVAVHRQDVLVDVDDVVLVLGELHQRLQSVAADAARPLECRLGVELDQSGLARECHVLPHGTPHKNGAGRDARYGSRTVLYVGRRR